MEKSRRNWILYVVAGLQSHQDQRGVVGLGSSQDRGAAGDGYRPFRRGRAGWQGVGVALYVRAVGMHEALSGDRR